MKKIWMYVGIVAVLLVMIFALNINQKTPSQPQGKNTQKEVTTTAKANNTFQMDKNFNIDEDLNIPKVIFVYSDPTAHHPYG